MDEPLQGKTENPRGFGGTPDPVTEDEKLQASPEEQQDYEMLVVRGRKMIFGENKDDLLELMGSSEAPAKGLGQAASMIVKSLTSAAKEQGRDIGPDAAINAGTVIVNELNELAVANGVFKYESAKDEEDEIKDGVLWGVKLYGDGMVQNGELTPEISASAKQQVTEGIREDAQQNPKKKKMASAVSEAMNPQPPGIIDGAMKSGV